MPRRKESKPNAGRAGYALVTLCCFAGIDSASMAEEPGIFAPSHERYIENITGDITRQYQQVLEEYDRRLEDDPANPVEAIEKCRFIEYFYYSEDYYLERTESDYERCVEETRSRFPGHPEIVLLELEQLDSNEAISTAEAAIDDGLYYWTNEQKSRLYESLSDQHYWSDDQKSAGYYAAESLHFNSESGVRLRAVEYAMFRNDIERALEYLNLPGDEDMASSWYLAQKIQLLLKLSAIDQALAQYERLQISDDTYYSHTDLSRQFADAGQLEYARAEIEAARDSYGSNDAIAREQFRFEMTWGDSQSAHAAYESMRDLGYEYDPLLRHRFSLFLKGPGLPWKWRDLGGLASLLGGLGFLALLPLIVLLPIHNRGLIRCLQNRAPHWNTTQWTMIHAWYASFAILLSGFLAAYVFEYEFLEQLFADNYLYGFEDLDYEAIGRETLFDTLLLLCAVLPLIPAAGGLRVFGPNQWSWTKAVIASVGLMFVYRFIVGLMVLIYPDAFDTGLAAITQQQIMIRGVYDAYGSVVLLVVIGLLIPVVEEFIFRGVLLNVFAKHINFRWANATQALIFAALHQDLALIPFFFAFGLTAGYLVKVSRGLFAPMLTHALHNSFTTLAVILLSDGHTILQGAM